jgi:hypothetical protein
MAVEKVLIIFLDGVGLGDDAEANPFSSHPLPFLSSLLDGHKPLKANAGYSNGQAALLGLDAVLGVPGLPQSATGQTAILTGHNAPALLGEHYGPYPNQPLRELLSADSLFAQLLRRGQPVAYASAYPDGFLQRLQRGTERLSANTRAAYDAGLKLRGVSDLQAGRAISGMLTNEHWQSWGYQVPSLNARQAGAQLVGLTDDHALTYFEFWYTDVVGHKQDADAAQHVLTLLDDFFAGIFDAADLKQTLLLVISDHGNFEDLSTKQHTDNPALTLVGGAGQEDAVGRLKSLTDIAPLVLDLLG